MNDQMNMVSPENAPENVASTYALVQKKLGRVPNMYQVMANSPAVLKAYVSFQAALGEGLLNKQTAERIALAAAEKNHCSYCLSAHDFFGRKVGLSAEDIFDARSLRASDEKVNSTLAFVQKILESPGELSQNDLFVLREAGISDGEILEIVANSSTSII